MLLTVITSALIDQMMAALSTTLVYSLIQGIVLAALAGLVILFTRKASSAMRYNLLIGVLILFSLASAVTFGLEFNKIRQSAAFTSSFGTFTGNVDLSALAFKASSSQIQHNYITDVSAYITAHHKTIVLIWFLVICIKAIHLGMGLQDVYRLRRTATYPATGAWGAIMQQMAQRLNIKQKIELLESGMAKVPMVIGHLKPVILFPIGLLMALTTAEVEAILMHELAHIRRRDYLVNLLQSLVEIVFFFNPAVLWISQLIKTERENCCDDLALDHNTSKQSYIQALVCCEEYQQAKLTYAVAFSGQKNSLINRVKRIVNNRNHSLNTFEKTLLTICLVISGLCLSAFTEQETIKKTVQQVVKAITHKEMKTEPVVENVSSAAILAKQSPTPFDTLSKMKSTVRNVSTSANSKELTGLDTGIKIISSRTIATSSAVTTSKKINLKELMKQDSADSAAPPPPVPVSSPNIIWDEMVKDGLMEKYKPVPFTINDKDFIVNGKKQPEALAQKYRVLSKNRLPHGDTGSLDQGRLTMNKIILQMAKDKLIKDGEENFSFKLNIDEFVLNNKKQPDDVFQRYLNDFVKKAPGGKMSWSYRNISSSKTITDK